MCFRGTTSVSSKGVLLKQSALLSGVCIVDFLTQALLSGMITVLAHNSFSKGTVPILLRGVSRFFRLCGYSRPHPTPQAALHCSSQAPLHLVS